MRKKFHICRNPINALSKYSKTDNQTTFIPGANLHMYETTPDMTCDFMIGTTEFKWCILLLFFKKKWNERKYTVRITQKINAQGTSKYVSPGGMTPLATATYSAFPKYR
jgi:hypothetical protein